MITCEFKNYQREAKALSLFKIETNYVNPTYADENLSSFLLSIQELLEKNLSGIFKDSLENPTEENLKKDFSNLKGQLPLISHTDLDNPSNCFSFVVLCEGEYTHGLGRFMADMLCKWLIPGRQLALEGNRSTSFYFSHFPGKKFYITEYHMAILNKTEYLPIKTNIQNFINQLRLNILAVQHARFILATKKLSFEEKSALIKENISSLLDGKNKHLEINAYDHMQHFLVKLSAEKNLSQIKSNLDRLMTKRPQVYDRDIYESINYLSIIFRDQFAAIRDPKFVSRLIGYHYLFNKIVKQKHINFPKLRHLNIKLFKNYSNLEQNKSLTGILMTMNLLQDTERFEQKHLIQAIKSCVPEIKPIKNSFILDKRESNIISYYLEIEKSNNSKFSLEEIKKLKKNLPVEVKSRIENVINPIFMPRNEEEILRNIILLSKQLKYVRDVPQLIITYDKQTNQEISFLVILTRLLKPDSLPIKEYFSYSQTFLKHLPEEEKIIGSLKNKYPKEANVFRVSLNKTSFYRKDFSLDLQKARKIVVTELAKVIGDFRDYNGGMIHKQTEALDQLKEALPNLEKEKEFLIENFFYSIKPGIMQSILDISTLKNFFSFFLQILEQDFSKRKINFKTMSTPKYILAMVGFSSYDFKDKLETLINNLKIPSFDLTSCFMQEEGLYILGYVYRTNNLATHSHFFHVINKLIENAEKKRKRIF